MIASMPENNIKQALFPETAEVIPNPLGTAPGFRMARAAGQPYRASGGDAGRPARDEADDGGAGDPVDQNNRGSDKIFATRIFQTFGISESGLDELVAGLIKPEEARLASAQASRKSRSR